MAYLWVPLGAIGAVAIGCVYVGSGGSEGPIFGPIRTMRERQVRDNREPPSRSGVVEQPGAIETYSTTAPADDSPAMFRGYDVVNAILEVTHNLAQRCPFPGICEAATLVSALVILISEDQHTMAETASRLRRCHLLVTMLQRAATVLVEITSIEDTDSSTLSKRLLIKNVRDAIGNMVDMIKTYKSKRRITQVVVSALFHRRMEEAETAIDRTFDDMMRWLQIDLARSQEEDRRYLTGFRRNLTAAEEDAMEVLHRQQQLAEAKSIAARRLRRKRNLNQVEIPEDQVTISEDLLGKGGFGSVFIADYNGRNVAAKVIQIDLGHCLGSSRADDDVGMETKNGEENEHRQRASIMLELQTMMRLRSPHTVNVYGAITSRRDRLVLVMELLTGGDLTSLLRHSEERLPEAQARRIIGDVCAGVTYLHSKRAVHGDLKSANVLLDGEGRAKIGDFGTSRWAQRSGYTGLATYKTSEGKTMHMMSFAWAAPEVLDEKGNSYASDVYSFGIVAWEVLSRQIPWEDAFPFEIYRRVVFKGDRPEIPAEAPIDIACIVRACWAGAPGRRPTSREIGEKLKPRGLQS